MEAAGEDRNPETGEEYDSVAYARAALAAAEGKPADKPQSSITTAILDNPKSFLPESGNGNDHDNGRESDR
jgi:hypothetical protein